MMAAPYPLLVLGILFHLLASSALAIDKLDLSEGQDRRPPPEKAFIQPPDVAAAFAPLMQGTLKERIAALKTKVFNDFVFIEGGTFQMGDFGRLHSEEKLYYTTQRDNKPLHDVTLSSFSLSRFKVTYAEFDLYSESTGRRKVLTEEWLSKYRKPMHPARAGWQEARSYCRWLGKLTGLSIDLPTEAQWEYAARNRGQFVLFPTNSGEYEYGYNLSSYKQTQIYGNDLAYPVGIFPSTPLGLYDMAENGSEWMQDWYSEDYYDQGPKVDPKGPLKGKQKVLRSRSTFSDRYTGLTMWRAKRAIKYPQEKARIYDESLRCALHSSNPVKLVTR